MDESGMEKVSRPRSNQRSEKWVKLVQLYSHDNTTVSQESFRAWLNSYCSLCVYMASWNTLLSLVLPEYPLAFDFGGIVGVSFMIHSF